MNLADFRWCTIEDHSSGQRSFRKSRMNKQSDPNSWTLHEDDLAQIARPFSDSQKKPVAPKIKILSCWVFQISSVLMLGISEETQPDHCQWLWNLSKKKSGWFLDNIESISKLISCGKSFLDQNRGSFKYFLWSASQFCNSILLSCPIHIPFS